MNSNLQEKAADLNYKNKKSATKWSNQQSLNVQFTIVDDKASKKLENFAIISPCFCNKSCRRARYDPLKCNENTKNIEILTN